MSWNELWNNRRAVEGEITLNEQLKMDGYGKAGFAVSIENWHKYIDKVIQKYGIRPGDSIFEIGCGAGAFLQPFYDKGHCVGGLDFSESLISTAAKCMPNSNFFCKEAIELNLRENYDYVISNGVSMYFPDHHYAEQVLEKMLKFCNKGVILLDINDVENQLPLECLLRGKRSEVEYNNLFVSTRYLYYSKKWFKSLCEDRGVPLHISDQFLDFPYSRFRFNIHISRLTSSATEAINTETGNESIVLV